MQCAQLDGPHPSRPWLKKKKSPTGAHDLSGRFMFLSGTEVHHTAVTTWVSLNSTE